jgi:L-aminopeptidase/D-esterase-like protein
MKQISITDIESIRIGQVEDVEAGTGCTVIISEVGAPAGLDVRGSGPAGRESELLKPVANADKIHAIVLGGGSAFGLDAAGGVMEYLEEHDIGFDVGVTKVPLVCQSDLFDLTVADAHRRPDKAMGYAACVASEKGNYRDGNYGAGTGATVGKFLGMDYCMKSGIGSYAVQLDQLKVGAIVAVNALGDIFDPDTNTKIAGLLAEDKRNFRSTVDEMYKKLDVVENKFTGNTTIGAIITNGKFNKTALTKIASVAHNGYARTINPVHTTADGDSIYAMSVGKVSADIDTVSTLAAEVMARAIVRAVKSAETAYGYVAYRDLMGL